MGTCECTSNEDTDFPELKIVQSKYSQQMNESFVPPPPRLSKMVSTSTIYSNVFKIANQSDSRISSKIVRARQKDLPMSEAAQYRDLMVP